MLADVAPSKGVEWLQINLPLQLCGVQPHKVCDHMKSLLECETQKGTCMHLCYFIAQETEVEKRDVKSW